MTATAPDGSPVGLYATLAPLGEPELIHATSAPASRSSSSAAARAGSPIRSSPSATASRPSTTRPRCYEANGERSTHVFKARLITDEAVDQALAHAGLRRSRWLDDARSWLEALPR